MSEILTYSLGILGLLGLFYGGNTLVKGTIKTANSLNLPAHLIAVTIVALGTSAPELVVSVNAVLKNSPDLAWGNVVGSNIANASTKGSAVDVIGGVSGTGGHAGRILSLVSSARFSFDAEL